MPSSPARGEQRWAAHPWAALALRLVLFGAPLVVATLVVRALAGALPGGMGGVTRMLVLAPVGFAIAVLLERLARRFLPLATLLRLTMLFPDQAPSRFKLARAAGDPVALTQRIALRGDSSAQLAAEQVLALITALGTHDRRTRGHCERVRVFTDLMAEELHLDEPARDRLRWAALLHDVGKLSIAEQVLNKPGRLDSREFAQMKRHPEWGAQFAAPLLPWLGEWGRGILEHHERYDGTGYPQGLGRTDISPAGRIIGLIDAFETMTAARTYKKAMTTRAAREELAACAGSHFDPGYVRSFLAVSLPRVVWAMGPLALVLQLPFLRSIAEAGARAGTVTGQASALAGTGAVAAGVTGVLLAAPSATGPAVEAEAPRSGTASATSPAFVAAAPAEQPTGLASGQGSVVALPAAPEEPPVQADAPEQPAETGTTTAAVAEVRTAAAEPAPLSAPPAARSSREAPSWTSTLPPGTSLLAGGGTVTTPDEAVTAPPQVVLLSAPSGTVREVDATLTFRSDTPGASFGCALDDGPWTACTSPVTFAALADGPHTASVRAIAPDGTAGPPVSAAFIVAAAPTIEAGPHGRIRERTATFVVSAPRLTDALECALDDGAWAACSGEVTFDGLADGRHVFSVRITGSAEVRKRTIVVKLEDDGPAPEDPAGRQRPADSSSAG